MSNLLHLVGLSSGRENDAVNFEQLEQDEPRIAISGEIGKRAISETYYDLEEPERVLEAA